MRCLLILILLAPLDAEELTLNLAPAQTHIIWTMNSTLHMVHGTFQLVRGTLRLDGVSGKAGGEIVIDCASGESGSGARDKRMRSEVLEVTKFAEAIFTPDKVEGPLTLADGTDFQVHGTFTFHGASHEMLLPVHVQRSGNNVTGVMKFAIPYVKWGLKDPSNFLFKVDKEVKVEVDTTTSAPK